MVVIGKDFIPHQLGLTKSQINKLIEGKPVNIPHKTMGSGAGDVVIHLKPQNARKLLTAFKKGKGMRLSMLPHEVETSLKHGMGFFQTLKKYTGVSKNEFLGGAKRIGKRVVADGASVVGAAVGAYTGNPAAGAMLAESLERAADKTIDSIKPSKGKYGVKFNPNAGVKSLKKDAKKYAVEAIDRQIDKLPPDQRAVAERALAGEFPDAVRQIYDNVVGNTGGYGVKGMFKKGSAEMKEKMARLREMKAGGKVNIGRTLHRAFHHNKSAIAKAFNKTFTPELGRQIKGGIEKVGKPLASSLIHAGIPAVLGVAGDVLGGPMGGVAGAVAGDLLADQVGKATGYGIKRGRGRPRKIGGGDATMSAPYKKALRLNYAGLQLNNEKVDNASLNNFAVNPRVRPSSTEMTLSPYQKMDSPAMNPFIPTYYKQQGGTSCGYGGKGLYGQ